MAVPVWWWWWWWEEQEEEVEEEDEDEEEGEEEPPNFPDRTLPYTLNAVYLEHQAHHGIGLSAQSIEANTARRRNCNYGSGVGASVMSKGC